MISIPNGSVTDDAEPPKEIVIPVISRPVILHNIYGTFPLYIQIICPIRVVIFHSHVTLLEGPVILPCLM